MDELPRSAYWIHEWITGPSDDSQEPRSRIQENWLRMDPPAHAWCSDLGAHDLIDERGHFHTADSWDICQLYPHDQPWTLENLLWQILPWGRFSTFDAAVQFDLTANWERVRETLEGLPVDRYHCEFTEGNYRVEFTVWLEPSTGLLLRREKVDRDPRTGRMVQHSIERGYQYGVKPPFGVFALPPADKPLKTVDITGRFADIRGELAPAEIQEVEALIATSNAAWNDGDFDRFSGAWHFLEGELFTLLPGSAGWEVALRSRPPQTVWTSELTSIIRGTVIVVHTGTHTHRPLTAPDVLWVKSQLLIKGPHDARWVGDVEYTLQKRPDGYRLVHWSYPSEEIREAFDV